MSKTILITGSTDGIGKLAASKLAKAGYTVLLHGRSPEKLTKVISEINAAAQNENVKGFVADFSDLNMVRKMGADINKDVSKIDVLINNAGVFKSPLSHDEDGLDIRFVVNYFAPCLLTKALTPLLSKSTTPRIINLSSAAQASISYEALSGKSQLSVQEAYAQSKLTLTMWSFYLARTLSDTAVIAVNPGSLLNTNMVKEAYGHHWSSADKGANIIYELAVSEVYEGVTGKYFDNDKGAWGEAHPDAYNESKIIRLMDVTANVLQDW